ncbi:hypothetical protein U9M48_025103, partial [Paspalum notatum var. saurae]
MDHRRVSSRRGRCRLHWVAELLNQQGSDWDHAKLLQLFNPADCEAISSIRIPSRQSEDFLAWHREKTGIFTVRSAYNLAMCSRSAQDVASSSSAPGGKMLMVQYLERLGATKGEDFHMEIVRNKFLRTLEKDSTCEICGLTAESSYHAVVECNAARDLRLAMRDHWSLPPEEAWHYTSPDWLLVLLDTCNKVQRDLVKLLLWQTWNRHNNITHAAKHTSVYDSVQVSRKDPDLKGKGKCPGEDDRGRGGIGGRNDLEAVGFQRSGWSKPAASWTKINVDGSYVARSGKAGVGVVARDHTGAIIFTSWRVLFGCTSAEEAEARACIEGLRLATQWSYGPVVLESDCARLVKALQAADVDKSEMYFLIAEAREFGGTLPAWRVSKVKREDNRVAHELAQLARQN